MVSLKQIVILLALFMATISYGQYRNSSSTEGINDYLRSGSGLDLKGFRGILDPSRIKMSHSFSMGYYSGGGQSASRGLYMNTIDYKISNPLSLRTHLGFQFQPSGPAAWNPSNNGSQFVGGADLNWHPTQNTNFRLSLYRGMSPYNSYYGDNGWGYSGYQPFDYFRP